MIEVRHLGLLRELADRGSVTAVAAATHRTPSAVSQQLRSAQRDLGVRLVEPAGRGLRLTAAGRLLAEGGREVERAVAAVQARLDEFRGAALGTVTVACPPSAGAFLLPAVLRDLAETDVDLRLADVDLAEAGYADLVGDHDLVIAHSLSRIPLGTEHLVVHHLVREPLDIALRAGHRLAERDTVRPEELIDQEWYGVPVGYPFDTVRLAVEEATGERVRVAQRLRDNRLVEALVADSDRVAVLPRFTTPVGAGLELRPIAGLATARHVVGVVRPDNAERLAVRRVLAAFTAAAARLSARSR